MHNIRRKWVRLSARRVKLPPALDRARCTPKQARSALAASARCCLQMLAGAFASSRGDKFLRDGWARPWPVGAATIVYMISHDTHHRGQVLMLTRLLGFPVPAKIAGELWNWEKLWRECGFIRPR
jgi:uncharacterized damage-inducible protein DinB